MDLQALSIIGCVWFCICLLIGHSGENNLVDRTGSAIAIFFVVPTILIIIAAVMFIIYTMFKTALGF